MGKTIWMLPAALLALALVACGGRPGQDASGAAGAVDAGDDGGGILGAARQALSSVDVDTRRLEPAQIIDDAGFQQPMVATRLLVPAGWQTSGGIRWNDGAECYSGQMRAAWGAVAPDNASVIEVLPAFAWQVQGTEIPTDPCPVAPYRSAREFLEAVARQARPGARVLDYSDWPELAQATEQRLQQQGDPPQPGQQRQIDAGRLLIGYQADGMDMREVLAAPVVLSSLGNKVSGSVGRVTTYRAPNGRLDLDLLDRVVESIEDDPQWFSMAKQRMMANVQRYFTAQRRDIDAWHARRMAEINARGEADRAAIRSQTIRDVAAIRSQTHANTMATNDRIHARSIDGIYERNAYVGTDGGTVHSSIHGGARVFQDNDNPRNAWSTDDPYVQPSNATELERIR